MSGRDWISGSIDITKVGPGDLVDLFLESPTPSIAERVQARDAITRTHYTHWRETPKYTATESPPLPGEVGYLPWIVGELLTCNDLMVLRERALAAATLIQDYEEVLVGHKRLVRELDVALCGEACAAKQATLGDIVHMVKDSRMRVVSLAQAKDFASEIWDRAKVRGSAPEQIDVPDLLEQVLRPPA
jgi:hypothetical protein